MKSKPASKAKRRVCMPGLTSWLSWLPSKIFGLSLYVRNSLIPKSWFQEELPNYGFAESLTIRAPVASEVVPSQTPTVIWTLELFRAGIILATNDFTYKGYVTLSEDQIGRLREAGYQLDQLILAAIQKGRQTSDRPPTIGEKPVYLDGSPPSSIPDFYRLERRARGLVSLLLSSQSLLGDKTTEREDSPTDQELKDEPIRTVQEYKDIFHYIAEPEIGADYDENDSFVRMRIAGPNPMIIKGVTKAELVEKIGDRISDEEFNELLGTEGDTVLAAGDEGRLLVTDFEALSATSSDVRLGKSFVTDPIAIYAEPKTDYANETIKVIAIQLGQNPDMSELVLANTTDRYLWMAAKTVISAADCNYHEVVVHLAHTHLVAEVFSISTQRNLSAEHPLYKLLMPHFEGSNHINNLAANGLIAANGEIDHIFAQTALRMKDIQKVAAQSRLQFLFKAMMPDVEIPSRGVDKIKVYPYREDILLIWQALLNWCKDYVDIYYDDDNAIVQDSELQTWAEDAVKNGFMLDFSPPTTKGDLVRTLAMIIHVCSAQHAAVNFPQQPFMTFCPNMTGLVWDEFPSTRPMQENDYLKILPPLSVAQEQLTIAYLLGSVLYTRLGEYRSNQYPYWGTLDEKVEPAWTKFNDELRNIQNTILQRNEERGRFAYYFLLPSRIPASINI